VLVLEGWSESHKQSTSSCQTLYILQQSHCRVALTLLACATRLALKPRGSRPQCATKRVKATLGYPPCPTHPSCKPCKSVMEGGNKGATAGGRQGRKEVVQRSKRETRQKGDEDGTA